MDLDRLLISVVMAFGILVGTLVFAALSAAVMYGIYVGFPYTIVPTILFAFGVYFVYRSDLP